MRGKDSIPSLPRIICGITPAHAGKSQAHGLALPHSRDHPRACGEKLHKQAHLPHKWGSPPRMRGKGIDRKIALLRYGITPAHAGKS